MAKSTGRPWQKAGRSLALLTLSGYILLSPALVQVFGVGAPIVRPWTMYSRVGMGLPKGTFEVTQPDGQTVKMTALQAAGLRRYPAEGQIYHFGRFVSLQPGAFAKFAAPLCSQLEEGARVTFSGEIGSPTGWTQVDTVDVCTEAAK